MNEISVHTVYTFLSDDGTAYNRDDTYHADNDSAASLPLRERFTADKTPGIQVLYFDTATAYGIQLESTAFVIIFNRDGSQTMTITTETAVGNDFRTIGPGQWLVMNVAQATVDNSSTVAQIKVQLFKATSAAIGVPGELLTIYKAST